MADDSVGLSPAVIVICCSISVSPRNKASFPLRSKIGIVLCPFCSALSHIDGRMTGHEDSPWIAKLQSGGSPVDWSSSATGFLPLCTSLLLLSFNKSPCLVEFIPLPVLAQTKFPCRLGMSCATYLDACQMGLFGFGLVHIWLYIIWWHSLHIVVMLCRSLICTVIGSYFDPSWSWYPPPIEGASLWLLEPVVLFTIQQSLRWKFLESFGCTIFSLLNVIQDEGTIFLLFGTSRR
jgi:hypothetical protein